MGPLDAWIVYRFIKTLVTPWDETDAFKLGVIDASGKLIIATRKMSEPQRATYTLFHRLVFNIKRLIEKIPGGKSKIGTYAAALYLLKEEMGDEEGVLIMEKSFMSYLKENNAIEASVLQEEYLFEEYLSKGRYKLINNMLDTKGDELHKGTIIVARQNLKPISKVLGIEVFQLAVQGNPTKIVVVSREDIQEV
jgi:hypothetical protein